MVQLIATAIKMKMYCDYSYNLLEIDKIYLSDANWYSKETLYDYIKDHPGSIKVRSVTGPDVIPVKSINGEKYVKSSPNKYLHDNLLELPRR